MSNLVETLDVAREDPTVFQNSDWVGITAHSKIRAFDRLKRCSDILISAGALVFLAPLLLFIALLVCADGGPALFGHTRVGLGGKPFRCLKFRSMVVDAEERLAKLLREDPVARVEWAREQKLKDDPRITRIGAFLRKASLDELPQLVNVLRGDMSLVGPRPIVANEVRRYGRRIRYYETTKPGITGLWQVSGRNNTSYRRRVAIDTYYCRHRSMQLDLTIMLETIPAVLMRRGSY